MRYKGSKHYAEDLICANQIIPNKDLRAAAKAACPLIRRIAKKGPPARYCGHLFGEQNKQLYVYPVIPGRAYNPTLGIRVFSYLFSAITAESKINLLIKCPAVGPYHMVMDSQCKTVGAIMYHSQQRIFYRCRRYPKLPGTN